MCHFSPLPSSLTSAPSVLLSRKCPVCLLRREYFQQNTATVTPLMAKMASWLTPLLPDQESAVTLTLTTMSSGPLERDKVGDQVDGSLRCASAL